MTWGASWSSPSMVFSAGLVWWLLVKTTTITTTYFGASAAHYLGGMAKKNNDQRAVSGSVHQMFVERFGFFFFFSHNNTQLWSTGPPLVYCCYYIFTTSNAMKEKRQLSVKPTAINVSRTKIKKIEIQIISRVDPFSWYRQSRSLGFHYMTGNFNSIVFVTQKVSQRRYTRDRHGSFTNYHRRVNSQQQQVLVFV